MAVTKTLAVKSRPEAFSVSLRNHGYSVESSDTVYQFRTSYKSFPGDKQSETAWNAACLRWSRVFWQLSHVVMSLLLLIYAKLYISVFSPLSCKRSL